MSTPILIYNGSPDPIGEVVEEEHGWAAYHYESDLSYDCISTKDEAIDLVIDVENDII